MEKFNEHIGEKYGHLELIKYIGNYKYLCQCDCNRESPNTVEARWYDIKNGKIVSCGCVQKLTRRSNGKLNRKQMMYHPALELNLFDDEHELYGRCKTYNTGHYYYFSMCDYEKIKEYCWYETIDESGYSRLLANVNAKPIVMHKLLGMYEPDHINRNPMDNRRENLDTHATRNDQMVNRNLEWKNKSGCIGVSWNKSKNKWQSSIRVDGKNKYLGSYSDKDKAIISRLNAEIKHRKERLWQKDLMQKYGLIKDIT